MPSERGCQRRLRTIEPKPKSSAARPTERRASVAVGVGLKADMVVAVGHMPVCSMPENAMQT